ncbi:NAD(P)/FAD-dependent oxidoreductase [uncultured Pseudoteredinibacter sp.]|uniref:NAD(P)/FAD-dependent oxidoreductase n=1 Tax=uncultured Pseudoteredinibacter sp. TaxID=1641701 RepID=UPI00262A8754|nr:NAD(P)/FAD-dependent oxidoreductase [uncultured Pseudoteredinibacter sp.]
MKHMNRLEADVIIIGAGPSGAIAAAQLCKRGHKVAVLEKQHFPRFSIGESLLPQCMSFIESSGMLAAVEEAGFQFKNGAAFRLGNQYTEFEFTEKFTPGWGTTFQVQRGEFDHILAQQAEKAGADIYYGHEITAVKPGSDPTLTVLTEEGAQYTASAKFILDASGFGRVLPRLLDLETPSSFPVRKAIFTHIEDNIQTGLERNKILITVHPKYKDVWYWLIPFSNGRSSIGVVATPEFLDPLPGTSTEKLKQLCNEDPALKELLQSCHWDTKVQEICGYSCDVKSLWGEGFALLGNAGEFLDPVFSSGVTIAMKSASLAVPVLDKQLRGEAVCWENEYSVPLKQGVNTFRTFVEAWYDGRFQDVIFSKNQSKPIRDMISSILAGYAWDLKNPYVKDSERRLNVLVETCRQAI